MGSSGTKVVGEKGVLEEGLKRSKGLVRVVKNLLRGCDGLRVSSGRKPFLAFVFFGLVGDLISRQEEDVALASRLTKKGNITVGMVKVFPVAEAMPERALS